MTHYLKVNRKAAGGRNRQKVETPATNQKKSLPSNNLFHTLQATPTSPQPRHQNV